MNEHKCVLNRLAQEGLTPVIYCQIISDLKCIQPLCVCSASDISWRPIIHR